MGFAGPLLSGDGVRLRVVGVLGLVERRRGGLLAEAEGAVGQSLVSADGGVGAHLGVGPAQFILDLLVALLDPVAHRVDPHHFSQIRCRMSTVLLRG